MEIDNHLLCSLLFLLHIHRAHLPQSPLFVSLTFKTEDKITQLFTHALM